MAQHVLVFEKDTNFVRELENGFGRVGADVEVVRDADAGIARARSGDIRLILLGVDAMGAPGEAFLVCKRFKSDEELAKIPFVIMGGSQHAESFESHKKLKRRRADEYIELPTSVDALLAKVGPLAGFGGGHVNGAGRSEQHHAGGSRVDEDIDAFAENAFGDLMREGPPPAPPEALRAAPAADSGQLERLREELTEVAQRARQADERAEAAERRAQEASTRADTAERRLKEAPVAGATRVPAIAGSSRDYLELREQLNRKDKELIALRDEVTQRDRQLLEESDRLLQLERSQAELQEHLVTTQRDLDDAQGKIRAYEVDREAVNKRLEDFRSRLGRAEEKGKRLEDDLEAAKAAHASELGGMRAAHEQALAERERAKVAELERARSEHAAAQAELDTRLRKELADARSAHESELAGLRAAHENELAERKRAAEAALASALAEASAERARALDALATERAQELSQKLADAENARNAALAGLERELTTKHGDERSALEQRHAGEIQALERKLGEADARGVALNQRIEELEKQRKELEATLTTRIQELVRELGDRTQERDEAQNELSAARASIASLERAAAQLSERVSLLEADLEQAHERIDQQSAKIALDKELLDRVRRALGIGIGLLEQQKQNVV